MNFDIDIENYLNNHFPLDNFMFALDILIFLMAIDIMLHKINPNLLQYWAIFRLILDEINFDNSEDDYFDIDIDFDFDVDIDICFHYFDLHYDVTKNNSYFDMHLGNYYKIKCFHRFNNYAGVITKFYDY